MKKLITLVLISTATLSAFSQKTESSGDLTFKKFKVDISSGYAKPQGTTSNAGALFAIEPKYAVLNQLSVGLRMEAAVTVNIDKTGNESSAKANASYLLTTDYYFTNHKFRPFVGVGAGTYTMASVDQNTVITSGSTLPTTSKFGFMTRVGFEYGHLRIGVEYNFVANNSGYLGVKIGVGIGGGKK